MPEVVVHPIVPSSRTRDLRLWLLVITALVVTADRLSKLWIEAHIDLGSAITIIPRVFRLTHVLNTGAAFSMFADSTSPERVRIALVVFSICVTVVIAAMIYRMGRTLSLTSFGLALILGGALGNLYDRIRFNHVVDFLEVHIGTYHWPDFNLADSAICVGACLLLLEIFRPQPKESASVQE
ncbi:signal peptidase II [Terriglobus albidus]|uniref:signal peptidase II n=1 Tax=Terriglobus albidus TaxID=1592106 RepID=UPI0021DF73DA|nr:signal peptidase II [Terriglobus albidus]